MFIMHNTLYDAFGSGDSHGAFLKSIIGFTNAVSFESINDIPGNNNLYSACPNLFRFTMLCPALLSSDILRPQ